MNLDLNLGLGAHSLTSRWRNFMRRPYYSLVGLSLMALFFNLACQSHALARSNQSNNDSGDSESGYNSSGGESGDGGCNSNRRHGSSDTSTSPIASTSGQTGSGDGGCNSNSRHGSSDTSTSPIASTSGDGGCNSNDRHGSHSTGASPITSTSTSASDGGGCNSNDRHGSSGASTSPITSTSSSSSTSNYYSTNSKDRGNCTNSNESNESNESADSTYSTYSNNDSANSNSDSTNGNSANSSSKRKHHHRRGSGNASDSGNIYNTGYTDNSSSSSNTDNSSSTGSTRHSGNSGRTGRTGHAGNSGNSSGIVTSIADGDCGSSSGTCLTGTVTNVSTTGGVSTWSCQGIAGGQTASCSQSTTTTTGNPIALVFKDDTGPAGCDGCAEGWAAMLKADTSYTFDVRYVGPHEALSVLAGLALPNVAVYVQPGGDGDVDPAFAEVSADATALVNFVKNGGRYLGTCMGGYFMGTDPGFNLLSQVGGNTDEYITSPGAVVKTAIDTEVPVSWRGTTREVFFQDGNYFTFSNGAAGATAAGATVLATYSNGEVAAVVAPYGNGKVGGAGVHPEAPTDWFTSAHLTVVSDYDLGFDLINTTMAGWSSSSQ
jgi:hypothetical protein